MPLQYLFTIQHTVYRKCHMDALVKFRKATKVLFMSDCGVGAAALVEHSFRTQMEVVGSRVHLGHGCQLQCSEMA